MVGVAFATVGATAAAAVGPAFVAGAAAVGVSSVAFEAITYCSLAVVGSLTAIGGWWKATFASNEGSDQHEKKNR